MEDTLNSVTNLKKEVIREPEGVEEKNKHKKDETKAKRILVDSIKDLLIAHVGA